MTAVVPYPHQAQPQPAAVHTSVTALVYADTGGGKSWLLDTAPKPLLVLDTENRFKHTPSIKRGWDPMQGPPPALDGTWETCVVSVRDFAVLRTAYEYLNTGQHPFRSLGLDSGTAAQGRLKRRVSGTSRPTRDQWDEILAEFESLVADLHDLTVHPIRPLEMFIVTAARQERDGAYRPFLQGQMALKLPYAVDIVGYLYTDVLREGENVAHFNGVVRRLLITGLRNFVAKDGTHYLSSWYGNEIAAPNLADMLEVVKYGVAQRAAGLPIQTAQVVAS